MSMMLVTCEAASGSRLRVGLGGVLTLATAGELRELLAGKLGQAGTTTLAVDLSSVAEADLSLPQLLVAAHRTARALGKRLEIVGAPAAAVRRVCEDAGFLAGIDDRPGTGLEGELWRELAR